MASHLRHRVEDFLYLEAELLDDRKLRDWLDLLADDVRYWMPLRYNLLDRPENLSEARRLLLRRRQEGPWH
jgi:3-phenylpropionate/cinnamic acid dioxygenase small subunit